MKVTILTKWLAVLLVAALVAVGWSGWQAYQWRQAYYAEVIGSLVYDVDMAHRALVRAREATSREAKVDGLADAHGYLTSAQENSMTVLERLAPFRKGKVVWMPKHYVPQLLQYASNLTPDMPAAALQRRIDLVGGLAQALNAGLTDRPVRTWRKAVDVDRLKQSLDGYFDPMAKAAPPTATLQFRDEENRPTVTARRQGNAVTLQVKWSHPYQLLPPSPATYVVLVRPGTDVEVSSSAGRQQRMGIGISPPYGEMDNNDRLPDVVKQVAPPDWAPGSYKAIGIIEGVEQTLTLRLPDGAKPDLLLFSLVSRGAAVPIPIE